MNILDLAAVAILALGLLIGWYHGLLRAASNLGALLLAIVIALAGHGAMAHQVLEKDEVIPQLIYYSESDEFLGDIETVRAPVDGLTPESLNVLLEDVALPHPVESRLRANLENRAFADEGLTQLGEYLSMTIAHLAVNIVCFLIVFAIAFVILLVVVHALDATIQFPVLRYGDSVAGAVVGILFSVVLLFVAFTAVPMVLSYVPFEELSIIVDNASVSSLFYRSNVLLALMKGVIG